jgi:hypothetical protein
MLLRLSDGSIVKGRIRRRLQGRLDVDSHGCAPMRLSSDVLVKAEAIASEWGLKTSQEAVEAVFRKYADEYMYGRQGGNVEWDNGIVVEQDEPGDLQCEAMNELDGLLG